MPMPSEWKIHHAALGTSCNQVNTRAHQWNWCGFIFHLSPSQGPVFHYYGILEDTINDQFIYGKDSKRVGCHCQAHFRVQHQSNGQVEKLNQKIRRYLCLYCTQNQGDWIKYLLWVEHAQNSISSICNPFDTISVHPGLTVTSLPMECNYGRNTELPAFNDLYQPDNRLWLATQVIRGFQGCRKLTSHYSSSNEIIEQINPVTFKPRLPYHFWLWLSLNRIHRQSHPNHLPSMSHSTNLLFQVPSQITVLQSRHLSPWTTTSNLHN